VTFVAGETEINDRNRDNKGLRRAQYDTTKAYVDTGKFNKCTFKVSVDTILSWSYTKNVRFR